MIRTLVPILTLACTLSALPATAQEGRAAQEGRTAQERGGQQRGGQQRGAVRDPGAQGRQQREGQPPAQHPTPTRNHLVLQRLAGDWKAAMTVHMGPGEPMRASGTEDNEVVAGGLWLRQHFSGAIGGDPFEGWGTIGYDTEKGEFVGTWIDSMSTRISLLEEGVGDMEAKTLTFWVQGRNPMTGAPQRERHRHTFLGPGRRTFTIEAPVPGKEGEFFTMMEVQYTRAGEEAGGARER